jgi:hypothetical protein
LGPSTNGFSFGKLVLKNVEGCFAALTYCKNGRNLFLVHIANLKTIDACYQLSTVFSTSLVYYRKIVEIMITGVNYLEIGSKSMLYIDSKNTFLHTQLIHDLVEHTAIFTEKTNVFVSP